MVQQLSLVSTISTSQLKLTLSSLTALTGMEPRDLCIHTVILRPKYPFEPPPQAGKINQIEQYNVRMNTTWSPANASTDFGSGETSRSFFSPQSWDINGNVWTLQVSDIPLAGKRPHSSQAINEFTVEATDDLVGYLEELGLQPELEYWWKGFRFYHGHVLIEFFRIFVKNDSDMDMEESAEVDLRLLDPSGKYIVKASVSIESMSDLDSYQKASRELDNAKSELSGLFDLSIPDRMSMDSRITRK